MAEPIVVPVPSGGWTGDELRAGFDAVAGRIEKVADLDTIDWDDISVKKV